MFKDKCCRLRIENLTRWSSTFLMLESIKRAYDRGAFNDNFPSDIDFKTIEIDSKYLTEWFDFAISKKTFKLSSVPLGIDFIIVPIKIDGENWNFQFNFKKWVISIVNWTHCKWGGLKKKAETFISPPSSELSRSNQTEPCARFFLVCVRLNLFWFLRKLTKMFI